MTALNIEGLQEFEVTWPWESEEREARLKPGTTSVLRVKNEARSLPWVLPPLLRATQGVVLVDNQSDDGTPDVAMQVAREHGFEHKMRVFEYPFDVSRCGPEHLGTPADSVHSLVYFYNWSFAHVETAYSLKWDGDMVLTEDAEGLIHDLSWQLPGKDVIVRVPRHSLYVESDRVAYLDLGLPNVEAYGYPMGPAYTHVKAFEWELRAYPEDVEFVRLPDGASLELKWLDSDEFAHWTAPEAFADNFRTARKRREYDLFSSLGRGEWEQWEHLHRIEAPRVDGQGVHVIDHVTREWLPHADREVFVAHRQGTREASQS